jgi:hypothetical protein
MKKIISLCFALLLTCFSMVAQDFAVTVKANQVAPGRKKFI